MRGHALPGGVLNLAAGRRRAAQAFGALRVRAASPQVTVGGLSGGNQQKVLLSRWLETHPQVLILDEPTRGVDIGAIEFIHQELREYRDAGCAILLVSVELDEIMSLADRILVMFCLLYTSPSPRDRG